MSFEPPDYKQSKHMIESCVRQVIKLIGENEMREGLLTTPERVARAYLDELCCGYLREGEIEALITKFGPEKYDQMIMCKDIEFYSLCEHHMLPFYGKCHIAYLPGESLLGISKLSRLVEVYARRLQVQERLTSQIANCIDERIKPRGVMVVMEAIHLCMRMRGVKQQNSVLITSALKGVFMTEPHAKQEFFSLLHGSKEL
jgi:GTP cyclohydrolase I